MANVYHNTYQYSHNKVDDSSNQGYTFLDQWLSEISNYSFLMDYFLSSNMTFKSEWGRRNPKFKFLL